MKKIWDFFKTYALAFAEKPLLDEGGIFLENILEKYYQKHPKACALFVSSAYSLIDTVAEDYAAQTKNTYDDHAVLKVKLELEEFASKHGFTLPLLDAD